MSSGRVTSAPAPIVMLLRVFLVRDCEVLPEHADLTFKKTWELLIKLSLLLTKFNTRYIDNYIYIYFKINDF